MVAFKQLNIILIQDDLRIISCSLCCICIFLYDDCDESKLGLLRIQVQGSLEDKEDQDYRINMIDKEVQIWLLESRDDLSLSKQLLVRILRRACYFYKLAVFR